MARVGEKRGAYGVLVGRTEGRKKTLGSLGRTLRSILKMNLQDGEWDWTDLAEDRYKWWAVVNTAMNLHIL